jgi:hypothetical protein
VKNLKELMLSFSIYLKVLSVVMLMIVILSVVFCVIMLSFITLSITVNIAMLRVHNFPHNADYRNAECHWGVPQCCGELHSV